MEETILNRILQKEVFCQGIREQSANVPVFTLEFAGKIKSKMNSNSVVMFVDASCVSDFKFPIGNVQQIWC